MIPWLYRYIFKGAGILFLIGVLTLLFLAIGSQIERTQTVPTPPAGVRR